MADCGAKTRSGLPCKKRAMANGRCLNHGGKCAETHSKNKSAVKAGGLYSKYFTEEDLEVATQSEFGKIDHELMLARVQLNRAVREQAASGNNPELESASMTEDNGAKSTTKVMRKRDYQAIIDRCLGRIASLELTRVKLMAANDDEGENDVPDAFVFEVAQANEPVRVTIGTERKE